MNSQQRHNGSRLRSAPFRGARRTGGRVLARLALALLLPCLVAIPASAQVAGGPSRIRNVYIPSDQLKVLFDSSPKGVLMPREKVLALWQEAQRNVQAGAVPPDEVVLTRATYDARLDEHELRITGRIEGVKLGGQWQAVDLPFGGLAIESAQLGGEPARFGRKGDGTLLLVLEKEGRFELALELSAPLAGKGGDMAATLRLPPVPASEILLELDERRQVQLGETILQPESTGAEGQKFRIAVDPTGLVPLVVSDRLAGGNRAPLVFARSRSVGHIEPAGLRWQVTLDLEVCARATDSFELQLPASVDVAEVEAPELARWTIRAEGDGAAAVALEFRKPLLGRRAVRLLGLAPIPADAEWDFPALKMPQAVSHVGEVLVYSAPSLRVERGGLAGIRPERLPPAGETAGTANAGAPTAVGAPSAFAFWDENFRLPLRVTPRRGALQASVATLVELDHSGAVLRSSMTIQPRHAAVFEVRIELPGDWEVTSLLSANQPAEWESSRTVGTASGGDAGTQIVRCDLAKPLSPGQPLEIALTAEQHPAGWLEEDERFSELALPDLRLAGADEVEGTVLVQAPPDIELLVADLSDDLQPVAADRPDAASTPDAGAALQYRYQDTARVGGRIQVRTRPAKISAETLAFVRPDHGRLDVHYQLDLHIAHGKIRQIRFLLPAAAGEKIRIVPIDSAARVIEQQHEPPPAADGADAESYLWRVVFDRPVTGDLALAIDFSQVSAVHPPGGQAGDSAGVEPISAKAGAAVEIPVLVLKNASRQSGIVALEAAGDQQIDCRPENLRDLDPADVPAPRAYTARERIVAAYQYQRLPYRLAISATRHASEPVLSAICESAEIVSVAGREGRMRHQARFWLRSLNLQHLPITLPADADLWTVVLDGQPVEVRRKQRAYIIPLPAGEAGASDARDLTLLYETDSPLPAGGDFWSRLRSRTIRQEAPQVALTTLSTTWNVHAPGGTDVVSSGGDFEPVKRLTRPTLAGWLAETIAYQSTSGLAWKFGGLVVAAIVLGLFALLGTGKGCALNLVQLLVVTAVIGILIALLLPATQSAREAARRSQCTNNLKQIGLALHNYHERYGQFPPAAIGPAGVPRDRQFSWIVALLPFLEQQGLYESLRLDLPWDDPQNAALLQLSLSTLECPSDPAPAATEEGLPKTSYVAIMGAESTQGPGGTRGVLGFDKSLRLNEIVDGASNTVMVAEATDGGPWFAGGFGTARRIESWIESEAWSNHPGGGNVLLADGSVRFLASTIDLQTLRHLATAQGADLIADPDFAPSGARAAPADAPTGDAPAPMPEAYEERAKSAAPAAREDWAAAAPPPAQPVVKRGQRGRLSLRVAIETQGKRPIRFRHEGGAGELVLEVQDQSFARTLQWLLAAAGMLAAWAWRRAPGARRAMAVVAGLAAPVGLAGLVPLAWSPLVDGVLLGALAAACLWLGLSIAGAVKSRVLARTAATVALAIGWLAAADTIAAEPAAAKKPPASNQPSRQPDLTLLIPYDPDGGDPMRNTRVYMPHDEFLRLWKQAHPGAPEQAPAGVRAIVSHAEYAGRLENGFARFDGRLLIHHLGDGWVRVALPLGDVALEKAEIDGQPATLAGGASPDARQGPQDAANPAARPAGEAPPADRGQPAIYLEKAGPSVVDVRFSVPVHRLGATGQMTVPLRAAPSGRLLFQLPADDLDVEVSGAAGGWRRQPSPPAGLGPAGLTGEVVNIPLGANGELLIRWQPRRVEARTGQLASADQSVLVEVLDSGVHLQSNVHYRIQQGSVSEVQLRIPPGMAIRSVQGADVADWSIEDEPATAPDRAGQRLVVSLKAEVATGTDVNIDGYCRDLRPAGAIGIEALEPLGVVRETGRLAIGCESHFRVRVDEADRLNQVSREELDLPRTAREGCAVFSAYRYTARPWRLQLRVDRLEPRVEVADRTAVAVAERQASLRSLLTADVAGAPISSLRLRLPAAMRVSQVRVPPGAEWFIQRGEKSQQLRVDWSEPAIGKLELAVAGSVARDSSQAEFVVPGVVVEGVAAQRGQLAVYLDGDLEAVLTSSGGARSIDPAALDGVLRVGDGPVHYAFECESPPQGLCLRLSPASARLTGGVTTVVSVREGAVAYFSQVDFEIRQAGRSRFQIVSPGWLGDDIELRGEGIRQIRSQAAGQTRTWEIELQQPVRDAYRVQLVQTLPLPEDGTVPAAIIRPLGVERLRSHVVLENLTADEIAATTTSGAAAVSIAEVPENLADAVRRQAVAAYRVSGEEAVLAWQRRVRAQETGLAATISLADLTTVIHADGRYRARAAYNIRNLTLQFLELELPPHGQVWSVQVSGQPVRAAKVRRQDHSVTLLPLQKISAGDFSSKVVVIYSGHLDGPLGRWTEVRPPAPRILSEIPVSRTLWTVLLPQEYQVRLVKHESNLEEVGAAYQQEERKLSFLDELRQMAQVASIRGKSGAQAKARYNLKQIGSALQNYARESVRTDAMNAPDVQQQAQQIEAEIKRLEELKTDAARVHGVEFYFEPPPQREGGPRGAQLERDFEKLSEPPAAGEKAAPPDAEKNLRDEAQGRPEQQRGKLREQAAEQLEKLQTKQQQQQRIQEKESAPQPSKAPEEAEEADALGMMPGAERPAGGEPLAEGQAAAGAPAAGTGHLSLDLDLALVGTPYHFRKLHGQPRLVLRARHESLTRWLSAAVWAGLCLALAAAAIYGLRRPDAAAVARRGWPWLAALAGGAWLFLLPWGIFGLALLVTAVSVQISRLQKRPPVEAAVPRISE